MANDTKAWHRVNYACNPKVKEYQAKWKEDNIDKIRESQRKSYLKRKNDPLIRAKRAEANKRWRQKNMDRVLFLNHQRERKLRGLPGQHTYDQWLKLKKDYDHTCPCCGRKEPMITLTEDHIIPISMPGSTNNIDNIQPLCGECNAKKYNKAVFYLRHSIKFHVRNK